MNRAESKMATALLVLCGGFVSYLLMSPTRTQSDEARPGRESKAATAKPSTAPQYTDKGDLKLPVGFETWVFVGSNMGIEYREGGPDADAQPAKKDAKPAPQPKPANFHNVYINPEAYEHYKKTKTFPEKTVLILDIYEAKEGEPKSVVAEGRFPGKRTGVAVAVKNSARPDGETSDWAYYDFPLDQTTASAFPDRACYDCHIKHADEDNVWVRFYPTLRQLHKR